MIKVKEFLDNNFKHKETTAELKNDGHYNVKGAWSFRVIQKKKVDFKKDIYTLDNCISCIIKDEVLKINIVKEGKNVNQYDMFTTSMDADREETDDFGYYKRSTDDEIINYIQHYMNILNSLK